MINAASSRQVADQPSNRKQKYLFHRDPLCFENKRSAQQDWKWEKKWLDIYGRSFQRTSEPAKVRQRSSLVCSSLQVFSRCNSIFPGVILALLLHGLFSFNYVHCKLDLLLAPTARQSDRHRRARGLAGFSRWLRSTEQRRSWNCGAPSASAQRVLAVSLVTGKRKMWRKLSVGRTWKRAKRLLAWQGWAQTRMCPTSLSEKTETWCSLIADSLAQNKPVVSIRHHNKELKRDPKTTRQTAATSELLKERLSSSAAASHFRHASDCAAGTVTTTLATVICPVTNPDNNFASCLFPSLSSELASITSSWWSVRKAMKPWGVF